MNCRKVILITGIVLATWSVASAGSKLAMSWKNPSYSGAPFHRILVIGMSENPVVRLDFEDALSEKLTRDGLEAVPGSDILLRTDSPKLDEDYLNGQIRDHHIDAVLVSRLISVDKKTTYVPGQSYTMPYPYYGSFYRYYGAAYAQTYTPGYLKTDTKVRVETNLYSAAPPDEDLVWIGYSDTFNPKNENKAIKEVVKLVVKALEKENVVRAEK
jgi:hypothetical protein